MIVILASAAHCDYNLICEFKNSRRLVFFDIRKYIYNIIHSDKERVINLKGKFPLEEKLIRSRMHSYSDANKLIAVQRKEWHHKKYNTIFESSNYIRLERVK